MSNHDSMVRFWEAYADAPTIESMMLSEDALKWDEKDRQDIVVSLPDLSNMEVVELGAGIGRFTGLLAARAKHVFASDFIDSFVEQNRINHAHLKNVDCRTDDAISISFGSDSKDLVFTNWLLMYFSNNEVVDFLLNIMKWLKPGGFVHVRESCTQPSTKQAKLTSENPTQYRHASEYITMLRNVRFQDTKTGLLYGFKVSWARSVPTYIEMKANWRQVHMLAQKVEIRDVIEVQKPIPTHSDLEIMLKSTRFDQDDMDLQFIAEEKIFGENGPVDVLLVQTAKLYQNGHAVNSVMNLSPGQINSFRLSKKFNACVMGICVDPLSHSALLGLAHTHLDKMVRFFCVDYYEPNCYMPYQRFDLVCGYLVLTDHDAASAVLKNAKYSMASGAKIMLVETKQIVSSIDSNNNEISENVFKEHGFRLDHCVAIGDVITDTSLTVLNKIDDKLKVNDTVEQQVVNIWKERFTNPNQYFLIVATLE